MACFPRHNAAERMSDYQTCVLSDLFIEPILDLTARVYIGQVSGHLHEVWFRVLSKAENPLR
jgi:hypothetical protein